MEQEEFIPRIRYLQPSKSRVNPGGHFAYAPCHGEGEEETCPCLSRANLHSRGDEHCSFITCRDLSELLASHTAWPLYSVDHMLLLPARFRREQAPSGSSA